jgi:sterol desaturase/sphingolipid hydroxylase (fatty acid hydroxylase superfamily)
MPSKGVLEISRFLILPALCVAIVSLIIMAHGYPADRWLPHWDVLLILGTMIILERIYSYKHAVPQTSLLVRDLTSTFVNVFVTGVVTGFIVLPILNFFTQQFFGRKFVFMSSAQLGPIWLQIATILLLVSFFRYWMHRLQHSNEFLWRLHSYHHRVTDLRALNDFTSNPVDFALRNLLIFVVLGVIGFSSSAFLFAVPVLSVWGIFSHCGGDVRGGWLNYVFATPEVHRWHHTAEVPKGYGYSVNYGVEFAFWDLLFGTYYLPQKDGHTIPSHIGHPGGLDDEGNYLRLLLVPLGLYPIVPWLMRVLRMPGNPKGPQPAN